MTDELRDKFRALVADVPPPTGVPSDAVFARIRTVRRRRATGAVAGLATAAVAAIAFAAGSLTGIDSAPPVTHTPNGPTPQVTGPPATSPTTSPTTTPPSAKPSIALSASTLAPPPSGTTTNTPPPSSTSTPPPDEDTATPPPAAPEPVELDLSLTPTVDGLKLSVRWRWTGSLLAPINTFTGKTYEGGNGIGQNAVNWDYDWGDGRYEPGTGQNGGGLSCEGASKRVSGSWTGRTETHTYLKPGTYTFGYVIGYCTPNGQVDLKKTLKVTVKRPTATTTTTTSP